LDRLGLSERYVITLNDVEIFNGVAANLELDGAARDEMRRLIDARDGVELERFLTPHATAEERAAFARLIQLSGKRDTLDKARTVITNWRSVGGLEHLESLWRVIESLGLADRFDIDLGDVSRLDYYTGLTFKVYVAGAGARIGSGGRYDGLTAKFGEGEPAIGFVLDLEALTDVLLARSPDMAVTRAPQGESLRISNDDPAVLFREAIDRRAEDKRILVELS
jgi:ATP phosphoribosyltransferase regulatory subunit